VVTGLANRVGTERLLWGSDWPQTDLGYGELVERAVEATADLGSAPAERVLDTNARALYGASMV